MYECCSDVLLHLGRMFGIVFMVQRGQIWPKNEKKTAQRTHGHCSKDPRALLKGPMVHFLKTRFFVFWPNLTSLNHENDTKHPPQVHIQVLISKQCYLKCFFGHYFQEKNFFWHFYGRFLKYLNYFWHFFVHFFLALFYGNFFVELIMALFWELLIKIYFLKFFFWHYFGNF